MENIARGCFISLQPCLCTRSTHIFSSLSLNQSSLLCIAPPPPFVSLFLQFPPLPVLYQFLRTFFFPPPSASSATKVPGWSLFSLPHPHPPHALSVRPGRPQENEAALSLWTGFEGRRGRKSSRERGREAVEERGTEEVTSPFFGEVCEVRKLQ